MVTEEEHSEGNADFIHKLAITQKETNESIYWLELLYKTEFISIKEFESLNIDAIEIIKILTSSIKTIKNKLNNN